MSEARQHARDIELASLVLEGSVQAWHGFVETYTPLIKSIIRRYVHEDEHVRDVWTAVLERLHGGLLRQYSGRSSLGTWLVFVTRSAAVDHLRRQRGRRRIPPALDAMPDHYRQIYRDLFVTGRSVEEVRHALRGNTAVADTESLAEIVAAMEDLLGDRTLRRVAWDLHADSVGAASGRLLEYLEQAADEAAVRQKELIPDRRLLHAETRRTVARIEQAIANLPDLERRAMELKFSRGLAAPEIARELSLPRSREVYTVIDRALRRLREEFGDKALLFVLFFLHLSR